MKIAIILPVFNEIKRLERGVAKTVEFVSENIKSECSIYIADNGSTDSTGELAKKLAQRYSNVYYYRIEEKGVGAAFRHGIKAVCNEDIIGYMDIDLSTDIAHLKEVEDLFASGKYDIVNGSRFNKLSVTTGRKWYRNITSYGLIFLLKIFLGMKASDAICGFKFFRHDVINEIVNESPSQENGWFYIIELLLRAERKNKSIYELPVRWHDDSVNSTVNVIQVMKSYILGIIGLRKNFRSQKS